jgi:DNA-binding HxlR family transcriptional regulator
MMGRARSVRDMLSAKWTVDVLYLLARGPRRHSWLYDHLLGISKKTLTDTLRGLERDGLVARTMYAEIPVRVEYALTPIGWSATSLLMQFYEWADDNMAEVEQARLRYDAIRNSGPAARSLRLMRADVA